MSRDKEKREAERLIQDYQEQQNISAILLMDMEIKAAQKHMQQVGRLGALSSVLMVISGISFLLFGGYLTLFFLFITLTIMTLCIFNFGKAAAYVNSINNFDDDMRQKYYDYQKRNKA